MMTYPQKERYDINDLIEVIRMLRLPDGCPWDKVQTHESIRMNFIEEVYEVIEAIDKNDTALMREELGDVLMQVVFHAQMEREQGNFDFDDVCDEVCRKLIIRHPHVFSNVQAGNTDEAVNSWEQVKQQTKGQTTYTETLESVAVSLPALMRAQKVGKRAAKSGFDFAKYGGYLCKVAVRSDRVAGSHSGKGFRCSCGRTGRFAVFLYESGESVGCRCRRNLDRCNGEIYSPFCKSGAGSNRSRKEDERLLAGRTRNILAAGERSKNRCDWINI